MLPFIDQSQAQHEVKNAIWRHENNMTNCKYLNRRDVKFFEGTLSHLNTRDLVIDTRRKRDKKAS